MKGTRHSGSSYMKGSSKLSAFKNNISGIGADPEGIKESKPRGMSTIDGLNLTRI